MITSGKAPTPQRRAQLPPSADELGQLGTTLRRTVPSEWQDFNGHVNVKHHYSFHIEALHTRFLALGLTPDYLQRHGQSTFTLEQHLTFYREILTGDEVTGHVRLLSRNAKLIHGVTFMADRASGNVASVVEFVDGHVDLTGRRTAPWQPELADSLDELLAEHRQLAWHPPLSGAMGLR